MSSLKLSNQLLQLPEVVDRLVLATRDSALDRIDIILGLEDTIALSSILDGCATVLGGRP